jgi:hypothetical protein
VWDVAPPVFDAEAVPEGSALDAQASPPTDVYALAANNSYSPAPDGEASDAPRRPCPICGEMIVATAAKCRFCDAIFDETLRREALKKSKKWADTDENLTTSDWIFCVLCSGITCICGIIYMIQGKPKGAKMVGVSILVAVIANVLNVVLQAMIHQR